MLRWGRMRDREWCLPDTIRRSNNRIMPATPQPIRNLLKKAEGICTKLSVEAKKLGLNRDFTLDGRFVGDVGELVAFQHFAIRLHEHQKKRHDGVCEINGREYGVQVKCRRKSTVLDMSSQPEILLVIEFGKNWETWDIVYNGPGKIVKVGRRLHLDELREAMKNLRKSSARGLAVPQRKSAKTF